MKSKLTVIAHCCVLFAMCWVPFKTLSTNIDSFNPHTSMMWVFLLSPLDRGGKLRYREVKSLDQCHRPTKFG